MSKILKHDDVVEILIGATFLGAGGGGSLSSGLKILADVEATGQKSEVEMLDLSEIQDTDYAAMVAGLGSPAAFVESGKFGPDAVSAFKAFQKALASQGKELSYLYSGEMGGFNTFVPMMVGILTGIKFVDVCGNGRAVPELNTSLGAARGYPPFPTGIGTIDGNEIVVYGVDDKATEKIARNLCGAYGMQIGFSTWGLNKKEMQENAVVGCVSKAWEIGKALNHAKEKGLDPYAEVSKLTECKLQCRGKIISKTLEIRSGFDYGLTVVQDAVSGAKYTITFQNENLFVQDEQGKVLLTAPELTSIICLSPGENYCMPVSNADTVEGMEVEIVLSPADAKWWAEDKKANLCWMDSLKSAGYDGAQVRYQK